MPKIIVDGKTYEVAEGQNLLHAGLSVGLDIPYFCWHPSLGSVGGCRQCAVKQYRDENDKKGRIVMACMTPAQEGNRFSVSDPEVKEFRATVIEALMSNHPHDCPVCDEGGNCHLQDMTVMSGHTERKSRFPKRTHENQYLGPFINHEMNRCIQCYRCVRYYRDYAGGTDLSVFSSRNEVYFGRLEDGVLESEFSGNLVEVCPTGVFTDKTAKKHFSRKWDLQMAPSVCVHCSVGCNITPGERYGELREVVNRYHGKVNGYFLCDRGRFGYEFVNDERRLQYAFAQREGMDEKEAVTKSAALEHVANLLQGKKKVFGIGSPRASLEANFALRTLVGEERFSTGVPQGSHDLVEKVRKILEEGPVRTPSLREMEKADVVVVLGEDVSQTAPRMALSLRQASRQQPMQKALKLGIADWNDAAVREVVQTEKGPFFVALPHPSRLDDLSTKSYYASSCDVARLGFALAHELVSGAPKVSDLPAEAKAWVKEAAEALRQAENPLVVSGISLQSEAVVEAAANVAWALADKNSSAQLSYVLPECNSMGVAMLGENSLEAICKKIEDEGADAVVVLENDLYRNLSAERVEKLCTQTAQLLVIDHYAHGTASKANVVLPGNTFAEGDGTKVSQEGRAQRFFQVFVPKGDIQESWRWVRDLMVAGGKEEVSAWKNLDDIASDMVKEVAALAKVSEVAPSAEFRAVGQKIPRQPFRYSGRTAMLANVHVSEPKPADDPDSALSFSMEGYGGNPPPSLTPFFWAPAWNSNQATAKFQQEVGGELRGGDPGARLLEPAEGKKATFFTGVPESFSPRKGEWLALPVYHVFGSEELSQMAPGVSEQVPQPYVWMNDKDAKDLQVEEGAELHLSISETALRVKVDSNLSRGIFGIPSGLKDTVGLGLPQWVKVKGGEMNEVVKSLLIVVGTLAVANSMSAAMIYIERRSLALWQDRYGPNRCGPFGLLQVVADAIKMFTKEDWIPPFADKTVFVIAPAIVVATVLMSFAVVPVAPDIYVVDLNIGLLFFLAMSSMGVYSVVLGGWASNNKYSLLGGMRACSQMITYEVFMGLSVMGVVMLTGSFSLQDIVAAQKDLWFVVPQFLGFVIFLIAGIAETHRHPFDLPEAESELIAGFHAEYSGMKFGMFFVGEYLAVILVSVMMVTLFFGGWNGPDFLPPIAWFFLKLIPFVLFFVLLRAGLARPRYDQLLSFGWKILLPLTLLNLAVTGAVVLLRSEGAL